MGEPSVVMARRRRFGIVLCAVLMLIGFGTMLVDRPEDSFEPRLGFVPGFSVDHRCIGKQYRLTSDRLEYNLHYDRSRWVASISLSLTPDSLHDNCEVALSVPRGSVDLKREAARFPNARLLTLQDDGSSATGIAAARIEEPSRSNAGLGVDTYDLEVVLPRHYDMFHSLGIGRFYFKFNFFAPGSLRLSDARFQVVLPDEYSFEESSPETAGRNTLYPLTSRVWKLRNGHGLQASGAFHDDRVRFVVSHAFDLVALSIGAMLALLLTPTRRSDPGPTAVPTREASEAEAAVSDQGTDSRNRRPLLRSIVLLLLGAGLVRRLLRRRES